MGRAPASDSQKKTELSFSRRQVYIFLQRTMPTMFKVLLFVRKHPTLLQSNFVHLCRVRFALLEKGIDFHRVFGALQRHTWSWWNGEDLDPETGLNHLYHALCNVMFLAHYISDENKYMEFDDRPHGESK